MLFHSWSFGIFFVVVFLGLLLLKRTSLWIPWLLLASYVFYGMWNPTYLLLILFSTALDFIVVAAMDWHGQQKSVRRRMLLLVSVLNNLLLLGFFKYADFVTENVNALLARLNAPFELMSAEDLMPFGLEYILPVGISFYTFQSLSYTIDFYRGRIQREPSFIRFATFVSFFPQLVAGPIERSSKLLPQLYKAPVIGIDGIRDGLSLFVVGLFKKVALANYLGGYVDPVYRNPDQVSDIALLAATFCFAWQIYFDFSGYTDMARGVAKAMGFELMINFNHPYTATSLGDFWARWHISLSTWFRDYVYVPLGGNRSSSAVTYRNLIIVFLVSGFWHGAAWTFIVWGAIHAVGVIATRRLERSDWYNDRVPVALKRAVVFVVVCLAWVFFRSESLEMAWSITGRILLPTDWADPQAPLLLLGLVTAVWCFQFLCESRYKSITERQWVKAILMTAMLIYLLNCSSKGGEFIYFQF